MDKSIHNRKNGYFLKDWDFGRDHEKVRYNSYTEKREKMKKKAHCIIDLVFTFYLKMIQPKSSV
ncbi:hypothetical protein [Bacillus sp. AK128]